MNAAREEWLIITEFPNYSISNEGRVRRDIAGRGICKAGRIIFPATRSDGYIRVKLSFRGITGSRYVHRLMAIEFLGPPPTELHEAAHKDGVKSNIYISNIKWATPKENAADKILHGTMPKGENTASPLSIEDVSQIKGRLGRGETRRSIARSYSISHTSINKIANGQRWKHVA